MTAKREPIKVVNSCIPCSASPYKDYSDTATDSGRSGSTPHPPRRALSVTLNEVLPRHKRRQTLDLKSSRHHHFFLCISPRNYQNSPSLTITSSSESRCEFYHSFDLSVTHRLHPLSSYHISTIRHFSCGRAT